MTRCGTITTRPFSMKNLSLPLLVGLVVACSPSVGDENGAGTPTASGAQTGGDGDGDGDGDGGTGGGEDPGGTGGGAGSGAQGSGASAGSTTGGSASGGAGAGGSTASSVLPARIRRLTNAEYNASVKDLLSTSLSPGSDFPPDTRQHGFSLNEAQRIDPVLARQLDNAAIALAEEAVGDLDSIAPCADAVGGAEDCAAAFIDSFAAQAYRRPLTAQESESLLSLYRVGAEDASYADGVAHVIRGVLQSPNFLYLTEIGESFDAGPVTMTNYEIASSMSYLLTGGPPDDELALAAAAGTLVDSADRREQALRLLAEERGANKAVRFVREWLGVDRISSTAKDSNVYPEYEALRSAMGNETEAFVKETIATSGASVEDLLGAPWTVVSSDLAALYGASGEGRVDVPDRPGLLNQAAFLSVYAHAHETAPVLRGVAVLRRISCVEIEIPASLDLDTTPPVPDPASTTRERFALHAQESECANCHRLIDPLGFSFEQFDGMGNFQAEDNGKPVDSVTDVELGKDFDGTYANSSELATALATSADVRECFARQVFRASSGEAEGIGVSEQAFVDRWAGLELEVQQSLIELLITYAESETMIQREVP